MNQSIHYRNVIKRGFFLIYISILANSSSVFSVLCLKTLAATHFKLRAFTLAEYCFARCKVVNVTFIQSLIEQENENKSKEAISLANSVLNNLSGDEKHVLNAALAK